PHTSNLHPLPLHDALPTYQIIRDALESLNTEHPGKMFDADAVAKRAAETVPGWHKLGGQSPHSATMVASGLLRTLREHGDVYSLDRKSTRLNSSHVSISYA